MNKDNYESILHEKFPYIDVLGEYVNSRTKILHRCNIHKYEWNTSPENLIRLCKYGCRICESESNNHISEKYSVNFYTELKKINPHFDDITFNTKEINGSKTIVNCTCKKCGHNWNITANALINKKSGCGRCSGAIKFDNEYFLKTLSLYNDHITPLEEYVNDETKILCKCNICNHTWKISPGKIKQGRDCPFCSKIKCINILSKSHDEFVEQMKIINPTINILGIYKNERTHIDVECDICKNIWSPTPSNLLKYRGCPICQSSNGERRVFKYLKDNNITFIPECAFDDCKDIKSLPFDFYLPDYNICVEYDGEQHFRPVKFGGCSDDDAYRTHCSTVKHDKIKNEYCISHNIDLIRIPYWNYESIENILRDYLSTKRAV